MEKEKNIKFKEVVGLLNKENFSKGIDELIKFRQSMFDEISEIVFKYPIDIFSKMPFAGKDGYHSKSIAYSIYHIFRIEDIVAHELINKDEQVLFKNDFIKRINTPIITTGNELNSEEILEFSKKINVFELYEYAKMVMNSTNEILKRLSFSDSKRKFSESDKEHLIKTDCVSEKESAIWLIDYWCNKDVLGLIKMPFSRHWIMHIDAMEKIKNKLCK